MTRIFRSILYVIATATHRELARQVRYLKAENQILRSKLPGRITIESSERQRLLKFGEKLGKAIHQLVTIIAPSTFLRWIREAKRNRKKIPRRTRGRPMTTADIRRLILKLARENAWGYGRIAEELAKLGIAVSESTIQNILRASGLPPSPLRQGGTWDDFLKRHASSLWEMDFFSQKVLTLRGIREVFVIAFLHVHTRRALVSPATENPNDAWVMSQAESLVVRMQAHVERFIKTLRNEVLDHFIIFVCKHLDSLLNTFLSYYHHSRPHQGKNNHLLVNVKSTQKAESSDTVSIAMVRCEQKLGGLLKSYKWAA